MSNLQDIQQLQVERDVGIEMERFIAETRYINSKNLNDFESNLANKVNLKRMPGRNASQNYVGHERSGASRYQQNNLLNQARSQEGPSRAQMYAQQRSSPDKSDAFQLPNIHNANSQSIADLHAGNNQPHGTLPLVKSARHSQVVSSYKHGVHAADDVYTGNHTRAAKGLGKMLASQNPGVRSQRKGMTLQNSGSGLGGHLEAYRNSQQLNTTTDPNLPRHPLGPNKHASVSQH